MWLMKKKSKFYINEIIFSEDTYLKLEYSCESNVLDSLPKTISLTDNHSWDRLTSSSVQDVLVGMWTTAKKWNLWSPDYENFLSGDERVGAEEGRWAVEKDLGGCM